MAVAQVSGVQLDAQPTVHWRSVAAGVILSLITMFALTGLGMAFGGGGLDEDSTLRGALTFAGLWTLGSALVSVFVGAYFSSRLAANQNARVGSIQGTIVAALVLAVVLWQATAMAGFMGRSAARLVGGAAVVVGAGAKAAADSNVVSEIAEDVMGDLNVEPAQVQVVATGVATRLARGNTEAAKNYLARQTGLTPDEADARIANVRAQAETAAIKVREASAQALQSTGWTMFLTTVLCAVIGMIAGGLGSRSNARYPLTVTSDVRNEKFRTATV